MRGQDTQHRNVQLSLTGGGVPEPHLLWPIRQYSRSSADHLVTLLAVATPCPNQLALDCPEEVVADPVAAGAP
jgi:hypothetical protein